ncbi:hypothetical protein NLU13_8199 [Sarocladium strictum]|uniref:Uncharacterized protein n=1 Tax=Sarocladium strictum TaxID=5046 RepID=A0AA39L4X6_SARSR|nr:hypothetical protein NLU13_8199 [Sarocladium strictum]
MRSSLAWLFLLLQVHLAASTNAQYYFGKHKGEDATNNKVKPNIAAPETETPVETPPPPPQPGAEYVDEALRELRRLPKPVHLRARKQSSFLGTAITYILKSIPTSPVKAPTHSSPSKALSGPLSTAVELLEKSAHLNNTDALLMLADFNFYGNHSHPRHLDTAYDYYKRLARTHGNSTAQYMVALYHSTGIGDVVPRDQATALLYYYFAAMQGDLRAQMATASRYYAGIGTPKNCEAAAKLYKRVADKAIVWYRQGPPGNRAWIQQSWKLPDEHGGIYGEGASVSSAGVNAFRHSPVSDAHAAVGDVIEYLEVVSQRGDSKATLELGRRYYEGQRGLDQDFDMARKYFFLLSSRLWKRDGTKVDGYKPGIEKAASRAAGYIGWMFLRGEGLKQNFARAKEWFERGRQYGDAQSQYGLGLMLLNGHGGITNVKLATELFKAASDQDFAPAQVQMGRLYLDQGGPEDLRIANNYFELAARHGNIEAHYYIAEMIYNGVGRERHCSMAMNYYKSVAEKAEPLLSSWADANDAFDAGETELAFLEYLITAEQGYEKAQTNIAYMLDNVPSKLSLSSWLSIRNNTNSLFDNPSLALIYWTRSSRQSNVDSLVKMGDYYFYGIGTEPDLSKAVQCYTGASDYSQSAQALFNLGWMHENGIGLTQDFHLAKRYYDHALEVNVEAYLPVTLSLMKLRLRSAWNTLTHGKVHSIQEEPRQKKDWSLKDWLDNFFREDNLYEDAYYDTETYDDGMSGGAGMEGVGDEWDDGGIVESFLIIGITMTLVLLLWWRQRLQQQHAQREDDARRREQGLPPRVLPPVQGQPGNPGFPGWAGGGFGL